MTRFTSRLDDGTNVPRMYESAIWRESRLWPGVQFQIRRMSLLRRHRLMHALRPLATEEAFHRAAPDDAGSEITAKELQTRIDEMVIRTALLQIKGLNIDGEPATVESMIEGGPESLAREIAEAIVEESSLNEDERKN
jgi:hypothetical protein